MKSGRPHSAADGQIADNCSRQRADLSDREFEGLSSIQECPRRGLVSLRRVIGSQRRGSVRAVERHNEYEPARLPSSLEGDYLRREEARPNPRSRSSFEIHSHLIRPLFASTRSANSAIARMVADVGAGDVDPLSLVRANRTVARAARDEDGLWALVCASMAVSGSDPMAPTLKDPANSRRFSDWIASQAQNLWRRRLNGGGGRRARTRLCDDFPVLQGKYRELQQIWPISAASWPEFPSDSAPVDSNSLRTRTGN